VQGTAEIDRRPGDRAGRDRIWPNRPRGMKSAQTGLWSDYGRSPELIPNVLFLLLTLLLSRSLALSLAGTHSQAGGGGGGGGGGGEKDMARLCANRSRSGGRRSLLRACTVTAQRLTLGARAHARARADAHTRACAFPNGASHASLSLRPSCLPLSPSPLSSSVSSINVLFLLLSLSPPPSLPHSLSLLSSLQALKARGITHVLNMANYEQCPKVATGLLYTIYMYYVVHYCYNDYNITLNITR
jgi:hypothetical protein